MSNGRKALLIGTGSLAAVLYAAAFATSHLHHPQVVTARAVSAPAKMPADAPTAPSTSVGTAQALSTMPPQADITIPPLPANATSVPDDDLLRLCAMVSLANAANVPPDKAGWQQAIPIAEKLQQGPCDCEQRNWLHHFVETGNSALTDSADQYAENVQVLSTLARNDKQAMALGHHAN